MSTQSELEFLAELQSKDLNIAHSTLKSVYIKNWQYARDFIKSQGFSKMDCEDIYQDAMTIFYKKIRNSNFELSSSLKTFLMGIIKNLIYSKRRKNSKISSSEIHEGSLLEDDLEQNYLDQERKNLLLQRIRSLGEKCQQVLLLYYFEQLSMKEISVQMNYSSDSVAKNKKSLCLSKLKQSFQNRLNSNL